MTSGYKYIDHTADIAIEVSGTSLDELFLAALEGWRNSVIDSFGNEMAVEQRNIDLTEDSAEELLVSFLQELNYLLESKRIVPVKVENFRLLESEDSVKLIGEVHFAGISKEKIKTEIKAVTFHQLDIQKSDDIYKTLIVFDI